jgi:hypothetical protein
MRPKTQKHKITQGELEALVLPPNVVLIEITHRNDETTTKSGIYVVGDQDFQPHVHAERWGVVYKVCDKLVYGRGNMGSMPWKTGIEVSVGDTVWFDLREALYAPTYVVGDTWYKLLKYEFLYLAKKDDGRAIPLNGYVLFSEYEPQPDSPLLISTNIDTRYGIVQYVGEPNDEYIISVYSDDIEVEVGDHVLFEAGTSCFPLESGLHNHFSEDKYVLQHRRRIIAVVDEAHENIVRLHDDVIGVDAIEREKKRGNIVTLKDHKNFRHGVVKTSSCADIPEGSVVAIPKQSGTLFCGLEYFTTDRIIFYEPSDTV